MDVAQLHPVHVSVPRGVSPVAPPVRSAELVLSMYITCKVCVWGLLNSALSVDGVYGLSVRGDYFRTSVLKGLPRGQVLEAARPNNARIAPGR